MHRPLSILIIASAILALQPVAALAYIGPGVGAGAIGAVLGVIGAIFLAVFSIVWYPIKRMIKGKKKAEVPATGKPKSK